jgi:hypothetical protein
MTSAISSTSSFFVASLCVLINLMAFFYFSSCVRLITFIELLFSFLGVPKSGRSEDILTY